MRFVLIEYFDYNGNRLKESQCASYVPVLCGLV